MESSLLVQYIIIAVVVIFAGYSLYKVIAKNFSARKFKEGKPGCDKDCGCS